MSYLTDTATLAAALKAGMSPSELFERFEPSPIAKSTLEFCVRLGAPPVEALERLAQVESSWAKAQGQLQVAASGPRSSARLVTLLPVVVLLGGQLLGLRIFNQLNPLLVLSIGLGGLLLLGGRRWSSRILLTAKPNQEDPGAALDCLATALTAGLPTTLAVTEVEALFGARPELSGVVKLAKETGLAVAKLARAEADRMRLAARVSSEKRIQEAGIKLMWPLGLAVLPAFVLIAVVPLAIAMLRPN